MHTKSSRALQLHGLAGWGGGRFLTLTCSLALGSIRPHAPNSRLSRSLTPLPYHLELRDYHLWAAEDGEFHIADQLLQTVVQDPRGSASHAQSARWFQLYTEIFADQGSLAVTEAVEPVIAGLVKIQTGLANVSASSYPKQAEEIFRQTNTPTEGVTHPETFIRARALDLWAKEDPTAHAEIRRSIGCAVPLQVWLRSRKPPTR